MPTTQTGFTDLRKEEGELLFPTLLTDKVIKQTEKDLGSYDFAVQHQQCLSPAEAGMFKRTYRRWQKRESCPTSRWSSSWLIGNVQEGQ